MSISEIQESIIEEFSIFDDWMDKYSFLIDLGNDLKDPLTDEEKTSDIIINGCQSNVWLNAFYHDGVVTYRADSDAIITKGIIALLIKVLSGQKTTDIMNADLFFIDKIGLQQHLSPTRSNGLLAMVKQIKLYATAYHAKYGG